MDAMDLLTEARERMSQGTVFGEPITHDGVVVIPVARIGGMVGAGTGNKTDDAEGSGGGLGLRAAPVGVFVIRNGTVVWRPAVDVNKIILGGQVVGIVALLTLRSLIKARRRRRATAKSLR
jgi:uncharacterized spore protein YtfJ